MRGIIIRTHLYLGLYLTALTVVWLLEIVWLPAVRRPSPEFDAPARGRLSEVFVPEVADLVQKASARLNETGGGSQNDDEAHVGESGAAGAGTVVYDGMAGTLTIRSADDVDYFVISLDAREVSGPAADRTVWWEKYSTFGWVSPTLGRVVRAPFEICFVLVCLSGLWLWLARRPRPRGGRTAAPVSLLFRGGDGRGGEGRGGEARSRERRAGP